MSAQKTVIAIIFTTGMILLIPLIAMQISSEVSWDIGDFIIAGCLLIGTGLAIAIIKNKVNKSQNRTIGICIVIALLLLVWVELAVGILGTPLGGN